MSKSLKPKKSGEAIDRARTAIIDALRSGANPFDLFTMLSTAAHGTLRAYLPNALERGDRFELACAFDMLRREYERVLQGGWESPTLKK